LGGAADAAVTRFFVPGDGIHGERILLRGDDAHHAVRVLRLGPGDRFVAVGPDGGEYLVEFDRLEQGGSAVVGRVIAQRRAGREPRLRVTVAQALIKGDKFDQVVEKATELGAHAFWPFAAARSVVRLDPARAGERVARWQRVAAAAARQSGRVRVPGVGPVLGFAELVERVAGWTAAHGPDSVVLAWEGETGRGLYDLMQDRWGPPGAAPGADRSNQEPASPADLLLIVGPEGGFAAGEAHALRAAGASPVSLGRLILRTETAAPAVLAMILYHTGDLGRAPGLPETWNRTQG